MNLEGNLLCDFIDDTGKRINNAWLNICVEKSETHITFNTSEISIKINTADLWDVLWYICPIQKESIKRTETQKSNPQQTGYSHI